jgi:hypothetical protein
VDRRKIAKEIYADQIRKVGTGLAAAALLEGEAVLDLVEIELLLESGTWMFANAASLASISTRNNSANTSGVFGDC